MQNCDFFANCCNHSTVSRSCVIPLDDWKWNPLHRKETRKTCKSVAPTKIKPISRSSGCSDDLLCDKTNSSKFLKGNRKALKKKSPFAKIPFIGCCQLDEALIDNYAKSIEGVFESNEQHKQQQPTERRKKRKKKPKNSIKNIEPSYLRNKAQAMSSNEQRKQRNRFQNRNADICVDPIEKQLRLKEQQRCFSNKIKNNARMLDDYYPYYALEQGQLALSSMSANKCVDMAKDLKRKSATSVTVEGMNGYDYPIVELKSTAETVNETAEPPLLIRKGLSIDLPRNRFIGVLFHEHRGRKIC